MSAPGWVETCRGTVFPWEVDIVGHFTVAYYFERFEDATLAALDGLGLGPRYMRATGHGCLTTDCHVRYLHELRAGDVLRIESAVIGVDAGGVRLGHKLHDADTGTLCATVDQRTVHARLDDRAPAPLPAGVGAAAAARQVPWDGPPRETRPRPAGLEGFRDSARDTVKPHEIDVFGQCGFAHHVHRFSAGGLNTFAAFGMTPAYMREAKRGFSTFEFQLRFPGTLRAGDLVRVRTGVLHVGSSSVRILHRMLREPEAALVAELDQFGVHLDTEARRPTPLPEALRARARALLVPLAPGEGA